MIYDDVIDIFKKNLYNSPLNNPSRDKQQLTTTLNWYKSIGDYYITEIKRTGLIRFGHRLLKLTFKNHINMMKIFYKSTLNF